MDSLVCLLAPLLPPGLFLLGRGRCEPSLSRSLLLTVHGVPLCVPGRLRVGDVPASAAADAEGGRGEGAVHGVLRCPPAQPPHQRRQLLHLCETPILPSTHVPSELHAPCQTPAPCWRPGGEACGVTGVCCCVTAGWLLGLAGVPEGRRALQTARRKRPLDAARVAEHAVRGLVRDDVVGAHDALDVVKTRLMTQARASLTQAGLTGAQVGSFWPLCNSSTGNFCCCLCLCSEVSPRVQRSASSRLSMARLCCRGSGCTGGGSCQGCKQPLGTPTQGWLQCLGDDIQRRGGEGPHDGHGPSQTLWGVLLRRGLLLLIEAARILPPPGAH